MANLAILEAGGTGARRAHTFGSCTHDKLLARERVLARAMSLDARWVIADGRGRFLADGEPAWVEDAAQAVVFHALWAATARQRLSSGIVLPWATAMQVGVGDHHASQATLATA
ncbi:MAG: hypothetical protein QOG31_271 [Thermoplasmata archaeon]|nr:hypothetical protein [Thermoplasmata archaeon]